MKKSTGIKKVVKSNAAAPAARARLEESQDLDVTPSQQIDEFESQVKLLKNI